MLRLYADFNSQDEQGRVWCFGREDLAAHEASFVEGLRVVLYTTDDFEVEATLVFDRGWLGCPDYSTLRYLDGSEP